jgi:5-methylcytosine-specific restriction endonuclease McrA
MPICILCGRYPTRGEVLELSNDEKFLKLFSLRKKILHRRDHLLKSYVAHTPSALPVLARGNGWHEIASVSLSNRVRHKRIIGVLNGKLYWDDFPHCNHHCDNSACSGITLTPGEINRLMGITPVERRPIDARTRRLVLDRHGGKCARCGANEDLDLHHRRPVIHGGTNHHDNLVPLCFNCHTYHSEEFTEHIWPDLESIFLGSEPATREHSENVTRSDSPSP